MPLGTERALIITEDEIAKQQFLITRAMFVEGVKICFTPWKASMYTLERHWVNRKEILINVIGLPHHL